MTCEGRLAGTHGEATVRKVIQNVVEVLIGVLTVFTVASGQHFNSPSGPIPLLVDSQKVLVKFAAGFSSEDEAIFSFDRVLGHIEDENVGNGFVAFAVSNTDGIYDFMDSVQNLNEVELVEPYYLIQPGFPKLVGDLFSVTFNGDLSRRQIDSINSANGVVVEYERMGRAHSFVLRNTDMSGMRLLDVANMYHTLSQVIFSAPSFASNHEVFSYRLFDHFHSYQDHIKRVVGTFNDSSVWDFTGLTDTLVVAVIDQGCVPHEDLPALRMLDGYDATRSVYHAEPGPSCYHGMALSGIIGASHTTDSVAGLETNSGMVSLNPYVTIMPIKIFGNDCGSHAVFRWQIAQGIDYAWMNGADVIVNAWGWYPPEDYPDWDIDTAIIDATTLGRNGKGCPVIFASGNNSGSVTYPARRPEVLAVGAVDLNDLKWFYSCDGTELDLVAPAGDVCLTGDLFTIDQMGNIGANYLVDTECDDPLPTWECPPIGIPKNNDPNYNCRFGGTSSASPIVGGVASLVLAKDPLLTKDEVYEVLLGSAYADLDIVWEVPSEEYGYGRVDAFRAILSLSKGDCNNNGQITMGDLTALVNHLFETFEDLFPTNLLGDVNCDGQVTQTDLTLLVNHLFVTFEPLEYPCFGFGD